MPDDFDEESSQGSFLIDVPEVDPQLEDASQFEGAIVAWGCNDDYQMGTMGYAFPFAAEQASQYLIQKSEQMFMKPEWGSVGCSPCLLKPRGWGMRDVVMVACGIPQQQLPAPFFCNILNRNQALGGRLWAGRRVGMGQQRVRSTGSR